ncbi:MAG: nucleotidyltransferase domain-containing protein [archaeon]
MSLLDFLKSNGNARRIFGKRELKIIEKQLHGINLTQSEKNRLSRDIRKKFEFIREASKFSEEFELKKGEITKKIIEEAKKAILDDMLFKKIRKIVLYGSVIKKEVTFRSDIDISVEFSEISLKEATLFRKRLLGMADERADIQVYNFLPEKIRREIDKGKMLYRT